MQPDLSLAGLLRPSKNSVVPRTTASAKTLLGMPCAFAAFRSRNLVLFSAGGHKCQKNPAWSVLPSWVVSSARCHVPALALSAVLSGFFSCRLLDTCAAAEDVCLRRSRPGAACSQMPRIRGFAPQDEVFIDWASFPLTPALPLVPARRLPLSDV